MQILTTGEIYHLSVIDDGHDGFNVMMIVDSVRDEDVLGAMR